MIRNTEISTGEDVETLEPSGIAGRSKYGVDTVKKSSAAFEKVKHGVTISPFYILLGIHLPKKKIFKSS